MLLAVFRACILRLLLGDTRKHFESGKVSQNLPHRNLFSTTSHKIGICTAAAFELMDTVKNVVGPALFGYIKKKRLEQLLQELFGRRIEVYVGFFKPFQPKANSCRGMAQFVAFILPTCD